MSEKMTPEQATHFEHGKSLSHEVILANVAAEKGCSCQAYVDWFTYRRWQAQGFQVQKGEKGTRLTRFISKKVIDKKTGQEKTATFPKRFSVFCRCQVKPIE